MKTKLLLSILLILTTALSYAQTGIISGNIKTSDGQPAEFVNIAIIGTNKGATADKNGNYQIKNISLGTYTVVAILIGLEKKEQQVEVKANETTKLDFTLEESAHALQEVIVSSNINKYNKNNVSTTLRLQAPLIEVPQNIQIVTNEVMKDQQVISMSDGLVRNVSGTARVEHWGDLYTNIISRGSQIQAFRNGFNVVNSYWGPLTEDMSFVENIEFVKGPAGFMLSSGDPAGLYNVVTKKPTGVTKGEFGLTLGSFDLYRTTLDLDGKLDKSGKLLYRLNLTAQNKKSFRPNEYNNRYSVAPVISYLIDDKTKLTFEYTYQRADMSNVGSYYIFSPDDFANLPINSTALPSGIPGTKINDHSVFVNLQHDFNKNWKVTAQVSRFNYYQEGSSMWPSRVNADGTMIRGVSIWDAKSIMTMGQVFVNGDFKTGFIRHRILGGLDMGNKDYIADWGQSHDLDTTGAEFDPQHPYLGTPVNGYPQFDRSTPLLQRAQAVGGLMDMTYVAGYLQDELGLFRNRLRLTLAGRYTVLRQSAWGAKADSASHFTPRIGLSGSITEQTTAYAIYDQAFTPQSGKLASGGKVQPITGTNMEIGIKRNWFNGKWNTTLAAYQIIKQHELTADPNSEPTSGLSVELGEKTTKGFEFDLRGTIVKGFHVIANYAYTDSKVTKVTENVTVIKVGDVVPGFAKHTANVWLSYALQTGALKGLGVNGGVSMLAGRSTFWDKSPDPDQTIKDYYKVDAGLYWENEKIKISANVFNLSNEYIYNGSYYSWTKSYYWQADPPRNYRVSINYKF